MGTTGDSVEHIDNYDNLLEEIPRYQDLTNQLVSRPREHYRWIRERMVWGWDFTKLTRAYSREFSVPISQAAWTVKGEVGRLSGKLTGYLLNSTGSELVAFSRLDALFQTALNAGNLEVALGAQKEINQMTFRHKAKYKPPVNKAVASATKRGPKKLTEEEKLLRSGVRKAVKAGTKAAEFAAKSELIKSLNAGDMAGMTDDELLRSIQGKRLSADGITVNQDQFGNTIPVIDAETEKRLTGGDDD